ncbi:hypothetical protein XAP6164_4560012 [Xanthomonas phaseoli pv. phaseoli]|nr:hypothetical protein XAP6164_4560012 [Xanthomonas phaseoli pv. phaseoli]
MPASRSAPESFHVIPDALHARAQFLQTSAAGGIQRTKPGGIEKAFQCRAGLGVGGGLQQHHPQTLLHGRIHSCAHHFHRARHRRSAVHDAEVALEHRWHVAFVVPIHITERAHVDQVLVHERGDVQFRPHHQIAGRSARRGVVGRQQHVARDAVTQQLEHRQQVAAGGRGVLQRQGVAAQLRQRLDRAVAAHEEQRVEVAQSATLGHEQGVRIAALLQQHRRTGRFADPIDPAAPQIAGHLARIGRHQDFAAADPDLAHARHHVIQQGLELLVMAGGIIADPSKHQDRGRRCRSRHGQACPGDQPAGNQTPS